MSTIEIRKIGITKLDTDGNHNEPKFFIAHINSRCFWKETMLLKFSGIT